MAKRFRTLTVLLVGVIFKQVNPFSCPTGDPCAGDIITLEDGNRRGIDVPVVSGKEICDTILNPGWHRFVDDDGNPLKIAVLQNRNGQHQCLEHGRCSTTVPISLTEPAPTNSGETKKLKGCMQFRQWCCLFSVNVCARFCDNDIGTIYYLTPPLACSTAYCTNAKGCSAGSHIENGQCKLLYPTMTFDPVITADSRKISNANREVTFKCEIFGPETEHAEYVIDWMKDAEEKPVVTTTIQSTKTPAEVSLRELFNVTDLVKVKMGFNLVCRVVAMFEGSTEKSPVLRSNSFYAGLSVGPLTLFVKESDNVEYHKIFVKPTVPIVCETEKPCHLDVAFGNANFSTRDEVLTSKCGVRFNEENWDTFQTFQIAGVRDQIDDGQSSQRIKVTLRRSFDEVNSKTTPNEWTRLQEQYVEVEVANVHASRCEGSGDPHFTTFDNNYYHYYKYGDFWLARNRGEERTWGVLEVQSRIWACRGQHTSYSCHCGVAVREGNHIISIDQCYWQQRNKEVTFVPPRLRKHTPGELPKSFQIYKNAAGTSHKIQLPSGAAVKTEAHKWEGFCGNNDGNSDNDLHGPNGGLYTKDAKNIVEDDFADAWRVTREENLFHKEVLKQMEKEDPVMHSTQYCKCTSEQNKPQETLNCPDYKEHLLVQAKAFLEPGWIPNTFGLRTKRGAAEENDTPTDEDDVDDDYEFVYDISANFPIPQWPTQSGITKELAVQTCTDVLLSSPVAQSCIKDGRIKDITSETIDSCVEDIKLTDDVSIPNAYIASVLQQCEESLASDISYWKPNISTNITEKEASDFFLKPSLPPIIADSICLSDCSGHGQCIQATCICHSNFTGPDCSIVVDAPPTAITFISNGLCDRRKKPCRTAYVVGEGFIDNENLSCPVEDLGTGETFKVISVFQSIFEVTCALPPSSVKPYSSLNVYNEPFQHFSIRVTVDGKIFSKALYYTIYDSGCYSCVGPGECSRTNNSCLIENHCFANSEPDPDNWCKQCLPDKETAFTNRTDNARPYIEAPDKLFVLKNDLFSFIVSAVDPENRPISIHVLKKGDRLTKKILESGNWTWRAFPKTGKTRRFSFIATDECGATSVIYRPDIRVIDCPCKPNGQCVKQDDGPIGSGRYKCDCNNGYNGTYCERFIIPTKFFQVASQRTTSLIQYNLYGIKEKKLGGLRLFSKRLIQQIRDNGSSHLRELVCSIQEAINVPTETLKAESRQLQVTVDLDNRTLKINGTATIESYAKARESLNYSQTGNKLPARNRNVFCQVTNSNGLRSSKIRIVIGFDHCLADPCVYGTCQTTESGYQCHCFAGHKGRRCQSDPPTCSWCCDASDRDDSCTPSGPYRACSECCKRNKICTPQGHCHCSTFIKFCAASDTLCCYSGRAENREQCLSDYGHLPDCEKDCCKQSKNWNGTPLFACGA